MNSIAVFQRPQNVTVCSRTKANLQKFEFWENPSSLCFLQDCEFLSKSTLCLSAYDPSKTQNCTNQRSHNQNRGLFLIDQAPLKL